MYRADLHQSRIVQGNSLFDRLLLCLLILLLLLPKPLLFKVSFHNSLVPRLDFPLILSGDVIWISSKSVPRIHSVKLTEHPVLPLQMTVTNGDAIFNVVLFLEALCAHDALNQRVLRPPANGLHLLLHSSLPTNPSCCVIIKKSTGKTQIELLC
jgi:hypothetical protein